MPAFRTSPGLRQWHTVIDSMLEVKNVSNFPVQLVHDAEWDEFTVQFDMCK